MDVFLEISMEGQQLFIGCLSVETSEIGLRRHFEIYGRVLTAVIIRDPIAGIPTGYGFVGFEEPRVVDEVLRLRHKLNGITVQVEACVPRVLETSRNVSANKIYVANLDERVECCHLKKYFNQFGKVLHVFIFIPPQGNSLRYGFVSFQSTDAVCRVLKRGAHGLGAHMPLIKVNVAYSETPRVPKVLSKSVLKGNMVNQHQSRKTGKSRSADGSHHQSFKGKFWDESYGHQPLSPSSSQKYQNSRAKNLVRYSHCREAEEDTKDAEGNPSEEETGMDSLKFPEGCKFQCSEAGEDRKDAEGNPHEACKTSTGIEDQKYRTAGRKFDRVDETVQSCKDGHREGINIQEITENISDKFQQVEIGESSKSSPQSSRSGEIMQKNEDKKSTHSVESSSRGTQMDLGDEFFKAAEQVPLHEESCKLQTDSLSHRVENSKTCIPTREVKKKGKYQCNFRKIVDKTRVVRFRHPDSESSHDANKGEKPNYGSYYDTGNTGNMDVGSHGEMTKLVMKDDNSTTNSRASSASSANQ